MESEWLCANAHELSFNSTAPCGHAAQLKRDPLGSTTFDGHDAVIRVHFLVFEAHPKPAHVDYGRVDGAFVSVFVNEPVPAAAEAAARTFIEEAGWDVAQLDQSYPIELESFPVGDPSRERFEQALIDGIVVTFNRWPVGAPDEDSKDSDGVAA